MDLFTDQRQVALKAVEPLAVRMRPQTLEEFVGQEHFLGAGKMLRRMIEADRIGSAIFAGPPGTGKTTLAQVIANHTRAHFVPCNAISVGVKEVREMLASAEERLAASGQRTVLFIDELHRFNRAQQDVLLKEVERGVVILLGATTENPFFAVNAPLVSRSQVFQFESLSEDDIRTLLDRALSDRERGFGAQDIEVEQEALRHLAVMSDGDARRALTGLELAVCSHQKGGQRASSHESPAPVVRVTLVDAEESIQQKAICYDGTGDEHYDLASAFIKSMRGSDPDAAVYWLARMLEGGEDPRFPARRIVIFAAEDVGNADPQALILANAALQATLVVGMPECQLLLSQAAIYAACAPKSKASANAIWEAREDVKTQRTRPVPRNLRDAHYAGAKRLGHGAGYRDPQRESSGILADQYLGVDKVYYAPVPRGVEADIARRLEQIRKLRESGPDVQADDA